MKSRRFVLVWLMFLLSLAGSRHLQAQQPALAQQPGPYFVGEPVVVQVVLEGLKGSLEPECRLSGEPPEGLTVVGPQVGKSSSSFLQSINGRVTRSETSSYRFSFSVTADRTGDFSLGPFMVDVDGDELTAGSTRFTFEDLPADPDMEVSVSVPDRVLYVGQQVPVTIRWTYAGEIAEVQQLFSSLQIRSPLFDQFEFEDSAPETRTRLSLATARGTVAVDASVGRETREGRDYIVVTGKRTMTLDRAGEFQSIPVSCRTEKVTSWGRNLFGDRVPRAVSPVLAGGEPVSFSVRNIPTKDRPESFAGAVGTGYSIDVSANRTVVQVGDPISLDVTIRGSGNLQQVILPSLSADGGLDSTLFQLPAEEPAGTLSNNARQFKVTVRANEESVEQIPPLAFSWFDPEQQRFQTTRSDAIAMQVLPARVISSADVVGAISSAEKSSAGSDAGDSSNRTLSFSGANLAIQKDPAVLLAIAAATGNGWWKNGLIYLCGIAAVMLAMRWQRMSDRDPVEVEREQRFRSIRQQLRDAAGLSGADAARRTAEVLRQMLGECNANQRRTADQLIADCETRIYDRSGAAEFDQAIMDAALRLAEEFE